MREGGELAGFTRDAVALLDARAAARRPDVAGMLARARALAERPPARVIPLVGRASGLAEFTGALRAELDAKVHERSLAGIPPLATTGRRRGVWVGVLAVAAAVVLAVVGGAGMVSRAERAGAMEGSAAGATVVPGGGGDVARVSGGVSGAGPVLEDRREVAGEEQREVEAEEQREVEPVGDVGVVAEVKTEAVLEDRVEKRRSRTRAAPVPALVTTLADEAQVPVTALEDEAQALWQRGELAAAEAKFREVLRVGGARRAELAYGDLFALVRQMRGADGQATVWREYLGRFPGGRFADDARAGLCRRATSEQAACWREYLERHPDGAHRGQAAQVVDRGQ